MHNIKILQPEEYHVWDQLFAHSSQPHVFQRLDWSMMLAETGEEGYKLLPLVYSQKEEVVAGILLLYSNGINGRKSFSLATSSYCSPVFSQKLEYDKHSHTFSTYFIIKELLTALLQTVNRVRLNLPPWFWDIRPYNFLDWKISPYFTHTLSSTDAVQPDHALTLDKKYLCQTGKDADIDLWLAQVAKKRRTASQQREKFFTIAKRRIEWLQTHQNHRLFLLRQADTDRTLAYLPAILSHENETVYFSEPLYISPNLELDTLPGFYQACCNHLAGGFTHFDFGKSRTMEISRIKDRLNGRLMPVFTVESPDHAANATMSDPYYPY